MSQPCCPHTFQWGSKASALVGTRVIWRACSLSEARSARSSRVKRITYWRNCLFALAGYGRVELARADTESPYIDTTLGIPGQPEVREYRIRAVMDDEEIGQYSVTK